MQTTSRLNALAGTAKSPTAAQQPKQMRSSQPLTDEDVEVANERVLPHQRGRQAQLAVRLRAEGRTRRSARQRYGLRCQRQQPKPGCEEPRQRGSQGAGGAGAGSRTLTMPSTRRNMAAGTTCTCRAARAQARQGWPWQDGRCQQPALQQAQAAAAAQTAGQQRGTKQQQQRSHKARLVQQDQAPLPAHDLVHDALALRAAPPAERHLQRRLGFGVGVEARG